MYTLAVLTYLARHNVIRYSSRDLPSSVPVRIRDFINCAENHEAVFRLVFLFMVPFVLVSYLMEKYYFDRRLR